MEWIPDSGLSRLTPKEDLLSPQLAPMDDNPSDTFVLFTNGGAIYKINKIKHGACITPVILNQGCLVPEWWDKLI